MIVQSELEIYIIIVSYGSHTDSPWSNRSTGFTLTNATY